MREEMGDESEEFLQVPASQRAGPWVGRGLWWAGPKAGAELRPKELRGET